jgi:hypothetical protein
MYANFMDIDYTPWRDRIPMDHSKPAASPITVPGVNTLMLDSLEHIIELLSASLAPPRMNLVSAGIVPPGTYLPAVEQSDIPLIVKRTPDLPIESLPYAHGYRVGWNAAIDKILNDITVSLSIEAIEHLGQMRRE